MIPGGVVPPWAAGRLAFSTLGCPGVPVPEVLALARTTGASGVELRCADGEPVPPDLPLARARGVRAQFADAGVSVVCLASYVRIAAPDDDPVRDLLRHIELAQELGSRFVRVFGGFDPRPDPVPVAAARLRQVADRIAGGPVTVLLETHDVFCAARAVASVLRQVDAPEVGALWDVVNPWRSGETAGQAAAALAPWLRHVQLKDVASTVDLAPVLPGQGVVPLAQVLCELDRLGYQGWLSLEWERAWFPQAPPLAEALAAVSRVLAAYDPAAR